MHNVADVFLQVMNADLQKLSGDILFSLLMGYISSFIIVGLLFGDRYLSSRTGTRPLADGSRADPQASEDEEIEESSREQEFSSILAGFSIAALAFILTINSDTINAQATIEFFLFAFILETISFLCFKSLGKRLYDYFGIMAQFAGLLALINGFFVIIVSKFQLTNTLVFVYIVGYLTFFFLTARAMYGYAKTMQSWNKT